MQSTDLTFVSTPALRATPTNQSDVRAQDVAAPAQRTASLGLAAVYLLFAYEWLISGVNKLMNAGFQSGLAERLKEMSADNPNHWYVRLLTRFAMPHAEALAVLIQWSELAVGLGLALGAVRLLAGPRINAGLGRWLDLTLLAALVGGTLMTVNYWFMAGYMLPWVNAMNAFDEGISLDGLLTLTSVALLVTQTRAMMRARSKTA